MGSFPWLLVQDDNAKGLDTFVHVYSAFLGPLIAILIVEYYFMRKQHIDIKELYKKGGNFDGVNYAALVALAIGAAAAFLFVDLAWLIGFIVAAIAYPIISKTMFKNSRFKKGTIFDSETK